MKKFIFSISLVFVFICSFGQGITIDVSKFSGTAQNSDSLGGFAPDYYLDTSINNQAKYGVLTMKDNLIVDSNLTVMDSVTIGEHLQVNGTITGGNTTLNGYLLFNDPGTNANSFITQWQADNSTTVQTSSLQTIFGANPSFRLKAPDDSGIETLIVDFYDNQVRFYDDAIFDSSVTVLNLYSQSAILSNIGTSTEPFHDIYVTDLSVGLSSLEEARIFLNATDDDQWIITINTNDQGLFTGASGGYIFDTDIYPDVTSQDDLGTNEIRWDSGYIDDINITNSIIIGSDTVTGGTGIFRSVADDIDTLTTRSFYTDNKSVTTADNWDNSLFYFYTDECGNTWGYITYGDTSFKWLISGGIYLTQGFADSSVTLNMTQDVYAPVTNPSNTLYAIGRTKGCVICTGDSIQISEKGDYTIKWDLCYSGANTDEYHVELWVAGVGQGGKGEAIRDMSTSNVGCSSGNTILALTAGDWVLLKIKNNNNANDATMVSGNFTIELIQ